MRNSLDQLLLSAAIKTRATHLDRAPPEIIGVGGGRKDVTNIVRMKYELLVLKRNSEAPEIANTKCAYYPKV